MTGRAIIEAENPKDVIRQAQHGLAAAANWLRWRGMPVPKDSHEVFQLVADVKARDAEKWRKQDEERRAKLAKVAQAENPQTPAWQLALLVQDHDADVMLAAMRNKNTPTHLILGQVKRILSLGARLPLRVRRASGQLALAQKKRIAREYANAHPSMPVRIVPGNSPPRIKGRSYRWSSPGSVWRGSRAPRWPYYKTYTYDPSTLRVVVGRDWLEPSNVYNRDEPELAEARRGATR